MAESRPLTADDFIDPNIREQLAQMFNDAKLPLQAFQQNLKQAAGEMKNGLGKTLPQTQAELKLLTAALKQTEKGTRDYFAINKQLSDLQKAEKNLVLEVSGAYVNLNQQYMKSRD